MTRRSSLRFVTSALAAGSLVAVGGVSVFLAVTAASAASTLGFATVATVAATLALILYSATCGKSYGPDR